MIKLSRRKRAIHPDWCHYPKLVATDAIATERLPDVAQDYGEYTLTRTHAKPVILGDTTYSIVVNFDMIYDSANPHSPTNLAAQPGSDYTLESYAKTVISTSGGSSVSYSWEPLIYHSSTTVGTVTRYHYTTFIPAGDEELKVRLLPKFDWADEGVLFDPMTPGTPWDDVGENALFEIRDNIEACPRYGTTSATCGIWWYGLYSVESIVWNPFAPAQKAATVQIKDGAICLIMTDSNNDGVITMADRDPSVKNNPQHPGKVLRVNTDDDDKNGVLDKWQRPDQFNVPMNPAALAGTAPKVTVQDEDDLAETILYAWIDPAGIGSHTIDVYSIFPNDLVMWTEATKGSRLHRGEIVNGQVTSDTKLATLTSGANNNVFKRTVYMEANAQIVGNVELHAKFVTTCNPAHPNGYDSAKMTGIIVDLDIDSDNSSPGSVGQPSRSYEEEWLEMHKYATGKIMKPNWGVKNGVLDCWNGYSNGGANNPILGGSPGFYPIIVQIPEYVLLADIRIQFFYAMASINPTNGLNAPPAFGDGTIRIWTKDGPSPRNALNVSAGGDFVMLSDGIVSYTPQQLGFSNSVRTITLYVEAVTENANQELGSVVKPETTIKFCVNIANVGTFEDEVRYVVSNVGSFYYELMMHPELMSAYASDAVYEPDSKQEFSLKIQTPEELEALGFSSTVISLLSPENANVHDGLKAALYREYITGKYVLAFAGTETPPINWSNMTLDAWADWIANLTQAFGFGAPQYTHAIDIALELASPSTQLNSSNTYITGHSLGGGLASTAAVISGFHAYTFNAAGLHPSTVANHSNYANAASLVTAYQVDWDMLTWGQYVASWWAYAASWGQYTSIWTAILYQLDAFPRQAVGTPVPLTSEYNVSLFGILSMGPAGLLNSLLDALTAGYKCHLMDQVIYGMEKRIF